MSNTNDGKNQQYYLNQDPGRPANDDPPQGAEEKQGSFLGGQEETGTAPEEARSGNFGNLPSLKEIEDRSGNYIISFGFPGSGKSTFQSFLTRYIEEGDVFRHSVGKVDGNDNSTRLINEWRKDWKQNRFPEATARGEHNITELRLSVTPIEGQTKQISFGFLEMSGENQATVVPSEGAAGSMVAPLRSFLRNTRVNPILVLFVDPEEQSGRDPNDTIFMNLLDYLEANFDRRTISRIAILLLVPKPALALSVLRQLPEARRRYHGLSHVEELNADLVELYLELTIPGTFKRIEDWPSPWQYARLHVGDPVEGDPNSYENASFEDIEKIFHWIYGIFSGGKQLGPSGLDKLKGFFKV